mmetsp:Transcript_4880/g.6956  ORF Transcript_4880/g.6956 Transcript_4880/m.6956 type:complete len:95 (-) Transcript_4880:256-540(-)
MTLRAMIMACCFPFEATTCTICINRHSYAFLIFILAPPKYLRHHCCTKTTQQNVDINTALMTLSPAQQYRHRTTENTNQHTGITNAPPRQTTRG